MNPPRFFHPQKYDVGKIPTGWFLSNHQAANGLVAPPTQSLADEISKVKSLWDAMREDFTKVLGGLTVWFGFGFG